MVLIDVRLLQTVLSLPWQNVYLLIVCSGNVTSGVCVCVCVGVRAYACAYVYEGVFISPEFLTLFNRMNHCSKKPVQLWDFEWVVFWDMRSSSCHSKFTNNAKKPLPCLFPQLWQIERLAPSRQTAKLWLEISSLLHTHTHTKTDSKPELKLSISYTHFTLSIAKLDMMHFSSQHNTHDKMMFRSVCCWPETLNSAINLHFLFAPSLCHHQDHIYFGWIYDMVDVMI